MNILYAKAVLYAYPHLDKIAEQIDELIEKKAYNSFSDFSPAIFQMEKIVDLSNQKVTLFNLKIDFEKILGKLTDSERDLLDYKYFKKKPKTYYENFDFSSRCYFRKQVKVAEKIAIKMEKAGLNDKWFTEKCLEMEFFKELLKRVKEREAITQNKKNIEKSSNKRTFDKKVKVEKTETERLEAKAC